MPPYSRAFLIAAALLLTGARKPQLPAGELTLDAANPVISVEIQNIPMRLRVDLDRFDSIELNPAAAARPAVQWEKGPALDVGRVRVVSRYARASLKVGSKLVPTLISRHDRECCQDVDGVVGPDQLPYATIRWVNTAAPIATGSRLLPLDYDDDIGLSAASGADKVRVRFSLGAAETVGTAAAGAELAKLWGGRWNGPERSAALIFGINRRARQMVFAHPKRFADVPLDQILIRVSDFGGDEKLPVDPVSPDDIVVTHRLDRQRALPVVTIGADRLSLCAEIVYSAVPRSLTLRCAFPKP